MFFYASKVLWFVVHPVNLLFLILTAAAILLWTGRRRAGTVLVSGVVLAAAAVAVVPVGTWLQVRLEDRFPPRPLPEKVDGILVLGGVADQVVARARGGTALNGAVDRIAVLPRLARRFPEAKLVFSGGSGRLLNQEVKEAEVVGPILETWGVDPARLILESRSRNTWENAVLTRDLVEPAAEETWLLVTSAFHMPRAVGCFRHAGWQVVPYPVDYHTRGQEDVRLGFSFAAGLGSLAAGMHEWLGLWFYYLTSRTDALFPAPRDG